MAEDHGASEAGKLLKAWAEVVERQRVPEKNRRKSEGRKESVAGQF